ncbi:Hypp4804 [Branchiostoma lanceolatum]|uniref:Hypp4804 protein n=1 Tax=Branchiostoma lanceolatum TaxID=7740 RepID=A0A8K0AAB7_BRALA|nr:Hypp4804 [Branchiostoma lanceolatum]
MKIALLFLLCLVAQFLPLAPCQSDADCPSSATQCCRHGFFGIQTCETRLQAGWPCDHVEAGVGSCPCVEGYECVLKPNTFATRICTAVQANTPEP